MWEGMTTDISLYLAQEGNITFKQLSREHQQECLAARQKEASSLLSAGAVKILNDAESRRCEEQHPHVFWTRSGRSG